MMPLDGIKVIDFTGALSGPYCSMLLGDMGAEVIKVERPKRGDDSRAWGPPYISENLSTYFASINRNKKSISLNIKDPEAKEVIKKLVKNSDILLENFRPGTMEKLGLGYQELKEINEKMIYCSISGFGQDGPYKFKPGYDLILQGMGGLMSETGEPNGGPVKIGIAVTDISAGMFACYGILSAIIARSKTGKGQFIDTSMLDCQVSWQTYFATGYLVAGKIPSRMGSAHSLICPYQSFKTKDIFINIAVGNEDMWKKFCDVLGLDIAEHEKFSDNGKRLKNRDELVKIIEEILVKKSGDEWLVLLEKTGIPSGPIYTIDRLLNDPQVIHRKMIEEVHNPLYGTIKIPGLPVKLSETGGSVKLPPPVLGEHSEEILKSLGYTQEQIKSMKEKDII